MNLTSQIKISNAKLNRDLSKNREKLRGSWDQQDKFSMEFRKALKDRDRISIKKSGKKTDKKDENLKSKRKDNSSRKIDDKDDSTSEEIEAKDKGEGKLKSKDEKVSKKPKGTSGSDNNISQGILPPKLDYGKDINPEFLDLINLDNKDVMIDEENKQIIILDDDLEADPDLDMEVNPMKRGLLELSTEEGLRSQGRKIELSEDFLGEVDSLKKLNSLEDENVYSEEDGKAREESLGLEVENLTEEAVDFDLEDKLIEKLGEDLGKEGKVEESLEDSKDNLKLDLSNIERSNNFIDYMDKLDKSQPERPEEVLNRNLENIQGKIVENMETMVDGESSNIKLELYPRNLGSINIELTMENGKLLAKILVEDKSTRQMFLNNTSKLVENLNKENINLSKIDVSLNDGNNWSDASSNLDQSGEGFNHEGQEDKTRQANLNFKRGRLGSNKQDTIETGDASLSDGGLDLLI